MQFPRIPRTGLGLRDVFRESYHATPYRGLSEEEVSPVEMLAHRSQGLALARQYLPGWLGGYGQAGLEAFDRRRADDPGVRQHSLRVGDYPSLDPEALKRKGPVAEAARRGAQAAGALAADISSQGALNIWWFINAYEAAVTAATQQAMYGSLRNVKGVTSDYAGSPFHTGALKVASAFPLVLGASAATGSLFRQPGYAAVLPSDGDRTQSEDPATERLLRTIGRAGGLLPYADFVKERPDVSRGEYEAYKAYLFGDKMPIKATADGIHGPEVSFLGKSVPLITGVLPIVGGIAGARMGVRKAGARLAGGPQNQFEDLERRKDHKGRIWHEREELGALGEVKNAPRYRALTAELAAAEKSFRQQQLKVDSSLLLGSIAGGSAGLGITAAGAALLEQIRRGANANQNRSEREREPELTPEL